MGTTYSVKVVHPPPSVDQKKLQQQIDESLQNINQLMSTYIDDSELSRFNQSAVNEWFQLSPETFKVVEYSLQLSQQTDGKFDVTVSPLISLWGFDKDKLLKFPDEKMIAEKKERVGWQSVILDKSTRQIKKQKPLSINLSAVAKGYGVDVIAQLLDKQGVKHYLAEIGGEIRVKGKNREGNLWRLGIETPSLLQSGAQQIIELDNKSIATSGDYRNFFEKEGVRYSHTIDPETGKPVQHNIASLTVIADSTMEADALATALMVLGEKRAIEFANRYNIPVYILVYKSVSTGDNATDVSTEDNPFATSISKSFQKYLQ